MDSKVLLFCLPSSRQRDEVEDRMAETGSVEVVLGGVAPKLPFGNTDQRALGGWRADRCVVVDADGGWVADCGSDVAPLLAAAPDLLDALEAMVEDETEVARSSYSEYCGPGLSLFDDDVWQRNDPEGFARIVAARAAIAKARAQ